MVNFTIPERLREKYKIGRKVTMEEEEKGIILKPLPSQMTEKTH
jgi:bifunctional DNA-binding transcriptional regulator/antitoxin component of YhaV-PrlF toxin-antitoxin module